MPYNDQEHTHFLCAHLVEPEAAGSQAVERQRGFRVEDLGFRVCEHLQMRAVAARTWLSLRQPALRRSRCSGGLGFRVCEVLLRAPG